MRGVNVIRSGPRARKSVRCHLIDVLCGESLCDQPFRQKRMESAVDMPTIIVTALHEIAQGPVTLRGTTRRTDEHGLLFKTTCVADAKTLILALRVTNV